MYIYSLYSPIHSFGGSASLTFEDGTESTLVIKTTKAGASESSAQMGLAREAFFYNLVQCFLFL
jgi:hypothetical protein